MSFFFFFEKTCFSYINMDFYGNRMKNGEQLYIQFFFDKKHELKKIKQFFLYNYMGPMYKYINI